MRNIQVIICLFLFKDLFFIGNIMILRAISTHKELQTPTNVFLASLAVADLLISLIMPIDAVSITCFKSNCLFLWLIYLSPERLFMPIQIVSLSLSSLLQSHLSSEDRHYCMFAWVQKISITACSLNLLPRTNIRHFGLFGNRLYLYQWEVILDIYKITK